MKLIISGSPFFLHILQNFDTAELWCIAVINENIAFRLGGLELRSGGKCWTIGAGFTERSCTVKPDCSYEARVHNNELTNGEFLRLEGSCWKLESPVPESARSFFEMLPNGDFENLQALQGKSEMFFSWPNLADINDLFGIVSQDWLQTEIFQICLANQFTIAGCSSFVRSGAGQVTFRGCSKLVPCKARDDRTPKNIGSPKNAFHSNFAHRWWEI